MLFQRQILLRAAVGAGVISVGLLGCSSPSGTTTPSSGGGYGGPAAATSTGAGTSSSASQSASAANLQVFSAALSPSEEVPPASNSKGQGTAEVRIDPRTNEMTWQLSYNGLTGPATAAHIHGPASAGSNAGVVVPFAGVAGQQGAQGKATITQAQYGDLAAGLYYVNIHTAQYPGGEIRGQLRKK